MCVRWPEAWVEADANNRKGTRRSMRLDGLCELQHEARVGMPYRASLVRDAEYDPKRALVSTVRLSGDDDKSEDHSQAPPLTDQGLIAHQADSRVSR